MMMMMMIWVRPLFTELGPKNRHFAKKQTNICRLSGDINMRTFLGVYFAYMGRRNPLTDCSQFCLGGRYP